MTPPLLQLRGVRKAFGAVVVADGLDLALAPGEALGVIGPNGAGKSTLFNLITADLPLDAGSVRLDGVEIAGLPPHRRCRAGIGRSYQIPQPFAHMSVFENALTARVFGLGTSERAARDPAMAVLEATGLAALADRPAGSLTLLQRKRLELARALATGPRLLLLDEIAGGLTEPEVRALVATIRQVRRDGVALVWIEHVVHALLATVDRLVVLSGGRWLADGEPEAVMRSDEVRRIYMGVEPA